MLKLIPSLFRWVSKSTPAVALLVVAAGVTGAYAASSGGDSSTATKGGTPEAGFAVAYGPDTQNLSDADRKSLEAFGSCMRENAPQPGDDSQPPDPAEGKAKFDAAFDKCKSELTDSLRQKFESEQAQREEYENCLSDNGATPPSPGNPPSKADLEALQKAQKACADKLPEGAGTALCMHGPGAPGGPGARMGPPGGPPGTFEAPMPPPPGSGSSGSAPGN